MIFLGAVMTQSTDNHEVPLHPGLRLSLFPHVPPYVKFATYDSKGTSEKSRFFNINFIGLAPLLLPPFAPFPYKTNVIKIVMNVQLYTIIVAMCEKCFIFFNSI